MTDEEKIHDYFQKLSEIWRQPENNRFENIKRFIKEFSNTSNIVGAFPEAYVRKWITDLLENTQICVSHGTVVYAEQAYYNGVRKTPQLDCIIWVQKYGESLSVGEFSLVQLRNVKCLVEIKNSQYSRVKDDVERFNKLVQHYQKLLEVNNTTIESKFIICSRRKRQRKIELENVIYLFTETKQGLEPDYEGWEKFEKFIQSLKNELSNEMPQNPPSFTDDSGSIWMGGKPNNSSGPISLGDPGDIKNTGDNKSTTFIAPYGINHSSTIIDSDIDSEDL